MSDNANGSFCAGETHFSGLLFNGSDHRCQLRESNKAAVPRANAGLNHSTAPPRLESTRMIAHWPGYADAGYLAFVEEIVAAIRPF
jgi:hypothetical protein